LRCAGAILALLLLALAATGCDRTRARFPLRTADGERPNLVLVTIDTLRADHLGIYGYPVQTSPSIDRLGKEGVSFLQSVASAPETSPAVASLLTGLYQHRNRVAFNLGTLPAQVTTLAERLQAAGYTTAGLVGNFLLDAQHGFAQGFGTFESFAAKLGGPSDDRGVAQAIAWLDTDPKQPWFLWIHFMDPHGPYDSADASWSVAFTYPPGLFGADQPLAVGSGNFDLGVLPKYQVLPGLTRPSEYVRRYDGEIRFTDAQVGKLLDALAARGVRERTLVVLTADHGESLTEHDEYFQHGWYLYDTTLRVPLVFAWPGVLPSGTTVPTQVAGVDLVPTLGEILGFDAAGLDGRSYAGWLFGDAAADAPAFAVGPRENHQFCIRDQGWKLIHTPAGRPAEPQAHYPMQGFDTPERFELYDLGTDPGEHDDRAAREPERTSALKAKLTIFHEAFIQSGRRW